MAAKSGFPFFFDHPVLYNCVVCQLRLLILSPYVAGVAISLLKEFLFALAIEAEDIEYKSQ